MAATGGAARARSRAISAMVSGTCPRRRVAAGWAEPGRCLGVGAVPGLGGGDGADGQGGHDQHGVPGDGGVEPDLGLIQAEAVLAGPELLFHRPSQPCRPDQPDQCYRLPPGTKQNEMPARRSAGGGGSAGDAAGRRRPARTSRTSAGPWLPRLPSGSHASRGQSAARRRPRRIAAARRARHRRRGARDGI
jgi:hypothetical protein